MNPVEIMRAFGEMCAKESEYGCSGCELSYEFREKDTDIACEKFISKNPEKAVEIIEKWAEENPKKTRQSEFLKMFPNTRITKEGRIDICPQTMLVNFRCDANLLCEDCKDEYWLTEVE